MLTHAEVRQLIDKYNIYFQTDKWHAVDDHGAIEQLCKYAPNDDARLNTEELSAVIKIINDNSGNARLYAAASEFIDPLLLLAADRLQKHDLLTQTNLQAVLDVFLIPDKNINDVFAVNITTNDQESTPLVELFEYEQLVELFPLQHGPKYKNEATRDLEAIVNAMLDFSKMPAYRFNFLQELEVIIDDKIYNLTKILKSQPDFEHLAFSDQTVDEYLKYVNHIAKFDIAQGDKIFDANALPELRQAEKLAIAIYTDKYFEEINEFLRTAGQVEEYMRLPLHRLRLLVENCLLSAAIASHGLSKLHSSPLQSNAKLLYRAEIYNDKFKHVLNKRKSASLAKTSARKVIFDPGFTSTSADKKYRTVHPVSVTYLTPDGWKDISSIAVKKHRNEKESLFPPYMHFLFFHHKESRQDTNFKAIPVRTPETESAEPYVSRYVQLESELLQLFNKEHTQHNDLDKLITFKRTLSASGFPVKQDSLILNQRISHAQMVREYAYLIAAATTLYNDVLSKPYKDVALSSDQFVKVDNVTINRNNHGLAHIMRCAMLVLPVIEYYSAFSTERKFRDFCKIIDLKEIFKIQYAMIFTVAGRESEINFADGPDVVKRYKASSAVIFKKYAANYMSQDDIAKYSGLVQFVCDPAYIGEEISDNDRFIYHIMTLAHNLDLMRCYTKDQFEMHVSMVINYANYFKDVPVKSEDQKAAENQLYQIANDMLTATGDRMISAFAHGQLIDTNRNYQSSFIIASTDPALCLNACTRILAKSMPLPQQMNVHVSEQRDGDLSPYFMAAAQDGLILAFDLLLNHGLNPNQIDENGFTPFYYAIFNNHIGIINLLFSHPNFDPRIQCSAIKKHAFHFALLTINNPEIYDIFKKHHFDIDDEMSSLPYETKNIIRKNAYGYLFLTQELKIPYIELIALSVYILKELLEADYLILSSIPNLQYFLKALPLHQLITLPNERARLLVRYADKFNNLNQYGITPTMLSAIKDEKVFSLLFDNLDSLQILLAANVSAEHLLNLSTPMLFMFLKNAAFIIDNPAHIPASKLAELDIKQLLVNIRGSSDINPDQSKKLAMMEQQVLLFDEVSSQPINDMDDIKYVFSLYDPSLYDTVASILENKIMISKFDDLLPLDRQRDDKKKHAMFLALAGRHMDRALRSIDDYTQFIGDAQLNRVMDAFPSYTNKLIQFIFSNPSYFRETPVMSIFINSCMRELTDSISALEPKVVTEALQYRSFVELINALTIKLDKHKQYADMIIDHILSDEQAFSRLFEDRHTFCFVANNIPKKYSQQIAEYVITHKNEYHRLINNISDFNDIHRTFSLWLDPSKLGDLFKMFTSDPILFKKVIQSDDDYQIFTRLFSDRNDSILQFQTRADAIDYIDNPHEHSPSNGKHSPK